MKFNTFIILSLLVTGCALFKTVRVDKAYLVKNAVSSYKYSRTQCYEAAKKVIQDMGGSIEKEKKEDFQFMSNRFNANTMVVGNAYSANIVKDDHKFYVGVNGDKNSCVVKILRYRVWLQNQELINVNERFFKRQIYLFFDNLKSQLEDDKF